MPKLTDKDAEVATNLEDADILHVVIDIASTAVSKKVALSEIKAFLKTYNDTLYATPAIAKKWGLIFG